MLSVAWVLLTLLRGSHSEQLQWPLLDSDSGCPLCKHYLRKGANFSSLVVIDNNLVIGAKNAIYQLDFSQESAFVYPDKEQPPDNFETCVADGHQEDMCQNYYKVILKLVNEDLFICGTSAFHPICTVRQLHDLNYVTYKRHLTGISPSSPLVKTTYLKLSSMNNVGFSATAIDGLSKTDTAIQRLDLKYGGFGVIAKTKDDTFWLNKPEFVYSFEDGEYVYFIFKENASENQVEQVVTRVGRICKSDEGSQSPFFFENFVSFVKTTIMCSYSPSGTAPYNFDSASSAYFLNGILYVVFTGTNTIVDTGSVICPFDMPSIHRGLSSQYKSFVGHMWKLVNNPNPFTCANPRGVNEVAEVGVLMNQAVTTHNVLNHSTLKLTTVTAAVIQQTEEATFLAVYAGSTTGEVLKVGVKTDKYEEVQTTKERTITTGFGAIDVLVNDANNTGAVFAMSQDAVTYIPMDTDCSLFKTCQTCQYAYPGCSWCYDTSLEIGMCGSPSSCDAEKNKHFGPFATCPAIPSFAVQPAAVTEVNYGETAVFSCSANNPEVTKLRWVRESGPLTHGHTSDGSLTIPSVTERDAGCYRCTLQGISGVSSTQACLSVLIAPRFTVLPTDNTVTGNYGEDVMVPCRAEGSPKPQFTWERLSGGEEDEKEGSTKGGLPEGNKMMEEGDLKLVRVIEEDAGVYRCTASNSIDTITADITVKVAGMDPKTDPINKGKSYGTWMIIIAVVVVLFIVVIAVCAVKAFKRNSDKKYSHVPADPAGRLTGYPTGSLARPHHTSLPSHNPSDIYHPSWAPHSSTIALPARPSVSPGFPTNLLEYEEQAPPPYQPQIHPAFHQSEHHYDEISMSQPAFLSAAGYNTTYRLPAGLCEPRAATGLPMAVAPGGDLEARSGSSYDVMLRDSPSHRLTNVSPGSSSNHSRWGGNSEV